MQKALTEMNLHSTVVADITETNGLRIVRATPMSTTATPMHHFIMAPPSMRSA
jgi:hypothetical protein